jgi:hypothetical protein
MEHGKNRFFNICEAYQKMLGKSDSIGRDDRRYNAINESLKTINEDYDVDAYSIRTKEEIIDSGKFQRDSRGFTDDADNFSAEDMILFLENALPYDDMKYLEFGTNGSKMVVGGLVDLEPSVKIYHDITKIIDGTGWEFEWEDEGCFSITKSNSKHVNPYLYESVGESAGSARIMGNRRPDSNPTSD